MILTFRKPTLNDARLYFNWANDEMVRQQSYQSGKISWENHLQWFNKKLENDNCLMLLYENEGKMPVGQIRFEWGDNKTAVIGVSVANEFRGKGYAALILADASEYFLKLHYGTIINAYIKETNKGSIRAFEKAGFVFEKETLIEGIKSVLYTKHQL